MEVVPNNTLLPGDPRLIEHIVCELKSQGIFDQFRKECIADVDTKPAYQNLRQRVEGSVTGFLRTQAWKPDMNKNQLREMLRKNIYESGFLEMGVERIVDQVVYPKINSVFLPQVEDVVYKFLGLEKPTRITSATNGPLTINTIDLLPTDLDPISPDSEVMEKSLNKSDKSTDDVDKLDDSKNDEFESPPFEPITEQSVFSAHEDSSNDSHVSGISGLTSHDSNMSSHDSKLNIFSLDVANQDSQLSKVSSNSRLSIITTDSKHMSEKMDISDDTQTSKSSKMDDGPSWKNASANIEEFAHSSENGHMSHFRIKEEVTDEIDAIRMEINEHQNGNRTAEEKAEMNIKMEIDEDSQMSTHSQIASMLENMKKVEDDVKVEQIKRESSQNEVHIPEDSIKGELKKDFSEDLKKLKEDSVKEEGKMIKTEDSLDTDSNFDVKQDDTSDKDGSVAELKHQDSLDDVSKLDVKKSEGKSSEKSERARHDSERKHSSRYSESKDKKEDKDRKTDKDRKDKDRHRSSSGSKDKDKYRDKSKDSKSKDKDSLKSSKDDKSSSKSKEDKEKDSSKSSKEEKSRSSSSSKYSRDRSSSKSESKPSKDRSESRGRPSKDSKSKDDKAKGEENKSSKVEDVKKSDSLKKSDESRKESELKRSSSKSEDGKSSSRTREHARSDSSRTVTSSARDRKTSASKDSKDRKDSKKGSKRDKDDHSSSRDKKCDNRRSADRDSNDGSSGIGNNSNSNSSKEKESSSVSSSKSKSSENSTDSSQGSNSGDSGQSDNSQPPCQTLNECEDVADTRTQVKISTRSVSEKCEIRTDSDSDTAQQQQVKLKKPKIASNVFEARRLMKVRKKLEKLEKKREREAALAQATKDDKESDNLSAEDTDSVDSESLHIVEHDDSKEDSEVEYTKDRDTKTRHKEESNCAPETSVVSKESWDALEAKLSLNVDYDSYIDENCDSSSSSRHTNTSTTKHPRRSSDEEDCLYFTSQISPTTERYLKKVASLQRDGARLAVVLEDCRKMAPPQHMKSEVSAKRPRKTNQKYHVEELEVRVTNASSKKPAVSDVRNNAKKKIKGKKRKLDAEMDGLYAENNNRKISHHFDDLSEDFEEVMEPSPSASNTSNGSIELTTKIKPPMRTKKPKKTNSTVHHSDTFPLPLSPESDVSASSVEVKSGAHDRETAAPVRTPRAPAQKSQRYSSDDLYKPRPFVSGSSRRQRGLLNNSTDKISDGTSAKLRR